MKMWRTIQQYRSSWWPCHCSMIDQYEGRPASSCHSTTEVARTGNSNKLIVWLSPGWFFLEESYISALKMWLANLDSCASFTTSTLVELSSYFFPRRGNRREVYVGVPKAPLPVQCSCTQLGALWITTLAADLTTSVRRRHLTSMTGFAKVLLYWRLLVPGQPVLLRNCRYSVDVNEKGSV